MWQYLPLLHFVKMEATIHCFMDEVALPDCDLPLHTLSPQSKLTDWCLWATNFAIQLQKQLSSWQVSEHSPATRSTPQLSPTKAPLHFTVSRVQSLHIQACNFQQRVVVDRQSLPCLLFLLHSLYAAFENKQVLAIEHITDDKLISINWVITDPGCTCG